MRDTGFPEASLVSMANRCLVLTVGLKQKDRKLLENLVVL